MVVFISTVEVN